MKRKISFVCAASLCALLLTACSESEEQVQPTVTPKAKTAEKNSVAETNDDPELKPMTAAAPTDSAKAKKQEVKGANPDGAAVAVSQGQSGSYVIQIGIQPSRKSANAIVAKLAESGIEAYISEVENPGELEGTYYRIRVGYFATIHDAKEFGKSRLEAAGFPWWVDNRSNDSVGNPAGDDSESGYEESYSSTSYSEPAPAESYVESEPAAEVPAETSAPATVESVEEVTEVTEQTGAPMDDNASSEETIPAPALVVEEDYE